eukprot:GHVS01105728.1.p2 GENE.GHVS01105728.1~~GHVS01105728.1.p2  ORF type:complete len:106 (+),score=12.04 GHVS01105728.1:36-353(+)
MPTIVCQSISFTTENVHQFLVDDEIFLKMFECRFQPTFYCGSVRETTEICTCRSEAAPSTHHQADRFCHYSTLLDSMSRQRQCQLACGGRSTPCCSVATSPSPAL